MGMYLVGELLEHRVALYLPLVGAAKTFFQVAEPVHSHQQCMT